MTGAEPAIPFEGLLRREIKELKAYERAWRKLRRKLRYNEYSEVGCLEVLDWMTQILKRERKR